MWREIREIVFILIEAAEQVRACARVRIPRLHANTVYMYVGIQIGLPKREPRALYSHFFFLSA